MFEEGFVKAIQTGLAGKGLSAVPGGYLVQLPKDKLTAATPQAWAYRVVTQRLDKVLKGQTSATEALIQIDCHGWDTGQATARAGARAIALAQAIQEVLRALPSGKLADADQTLVAEIDLESVTDGFNDASRSVVRSLDYRVLFYRK